MTPFVAEYIGTMMLILLGQGNNANLTLNHSYGKGAGWLGTSLGWGIAVFVGVFIAAPFSGAHLNPAVTIGLAAAGKFEWGTVGLYVVAQMLGAMTGSFMTWLHFRNHYNQTEDVSAVLGTFSTGPAIKSTLDNVISEIIGTFALVFAVFYLSGAMINEQAASLGSIDALPVALVVVGVGLSLGGTTGYAINPARDLGPRIMHFLLPIQTKGDSNWSYSWIPVIGPILGALLAAFIFQLVIH